MPPWVTHIRSTSISLVESSTNPTIDLRRHRIVTLYRKEALNGWKRNLILISLYPCSIRIEPYLLWMKARIDRLIRWFTVLRLKIEIDHRVGAIWPGYGATPGLP